MWPSLYTATSCQSGNHLIRAMRSRKKRKSNTCCTEEKEKKRFLFLMKITFHSVTIWPPNIHDCHRGTISYHRHLENSLVLSDSDSHQSRGFFGAATKFPGKSSTCGPGIHGRHRTWGWYWMVLETLKNWGHWKLVHLDIAWVPWLNACTTTC